MSDVREAATPATANENGPNPKGDFIWYELMTPDAEGAKAFYDAVVGWNISEGAPEFGGYRMIGRSDGGNAGGVLPPPLRTRRKPTCAFGRRHGRQGCPVIVEPRAACHAGDVLREAIEEAK